MTDRTPGRLPLRRKGPKHARPTRGPALGAVLLVVGVIAALGGLVTLVVNLSAPSTFTGQARAAPATTQRQTGPTPVAPLAPQGNWTTLINPAVGLSYQIPPTLWSTNPQVGTIGSMTLTQGAERTAYTCGQPLERLLRGVLGSGSAPRIDPGSLAASFAQAAAVQYYSTNGTPPKVTIDPPQPVRRQSPSGATLTGVLVHATVTQHADPCLASEGELLVFVLQFPDHDGVLLVNADVAGGPAQPAPATDAELRAIVGTVQPTK